MVDVACEILKCDRDELLDQLKSVHVHYHDVEHPFSILETIIVKNLSDKIGHEATAKLLDPAFHAFNKTRKRQLCLFPNTRETLQNLKHNGIKTVAYTDSKYFGAVGRIMRLNLINLFDRIYCREKSMTKMPASYKPSDLSEISRIVVELPSHQSKPNPIVLKDIIRCESFVMDQCVYIGDSIAKDILMAKKAGCFSVWAKFGAHTDKVMYEKLIRISHWTTADIEREKNYSEEAKQVRPDFICENSLAELMALVN